MKRKPNVDMPRQNMEPKVWSFFFLWNRKEREYLMA